MIGPQGAVITVHYTASERQRLLLGYPSLDPPLRLSAPRSHREPVAMLLETSGALSVIAEHHLRDHRRGPMSRVTAIYDVLPEGIIRPTLELMAHCGFLVRAHIIRSHPITPLLVQLTATHGGHRLIETVYQLLPAPELEALFEAQEAYDRCWWYLESRGLHQPPPR